MNLKAFLLCALVFVAVLGQCACAALTEAEFKRMKIKDLRQFLEERGLTCLGCQEKSEFVRLAFQNRDKPPVGGKAKREVPDAKFWDAWSATAKKECEEATKKRGQDPSAEPYAAVCSTISMATESFLMQHGKRVATKLKKTPDALLKTSYRDVYYDAGVVILQKLIRHCLASQSIQTKCQSLGFVTSTMEDAKVADYKAWVTNVGIENTNTMYEILDDGADL